MFTLFPKIRVAQTDVVTVTTSAGHNVALANVVLAGPTDEHHDVTGAASTPAGYALDLWQAGEYSLIVMVSATAAPWSLDVRIDVNGVALRTDHLTHGDPITRWRLGVS